MPLRAITYLTLQLLVLTACYWPWLIGRQVFYYEDSTQFFEPLCNFIGQAFRAGRLPLWNPYSYCGMPQIAISSPSIFYPLHILFAPLSYSQALAVIMIISQSVCGLGGLLLVAELGWGFYPSLLCGAILALSGYMFSLTANYTLITSACWLPLAAWCLLKMKTRAAHPGWTVGLALCTALVISAGRPEIAAPGLAALVFFAGYIAVMEPLGQPRPVFLAALVRSLLLGGLLSMPVMLPMLEWIPLSRRSGGLNHVETLMFSANWYDLIGLFASQPLGDLQLRGNLFRKLIEPNNIGPYFNSAFVGSVPLMFAIAGLCSPGGRLKKLGLLGLLISLIATLGGNFPFMNQIADCLPLVSVLRFPSKYLFFVVFFIALFAARGMRDCLLSPLKLKVASFFMLVFAATGLVIRQIPYVVLPFLSTLAQTNELRLHAQQLIGQGLFIWSALAALVGWGTRLALPNRSPRYKSAIALGTVAVSAACMLFHAFHNARTGAPANFYSVRSQLADALNKLADADKLPPNNRRYIGFYLQQFTVPPVAASPDPLRNTINAFQYSRQILRPFTNIDCGWPSAFGFEGAMIGEYYYLLLNSYFKSTQALPQYDAAEAMPLPSVRSDLPLNRLLSITSTNYAVSQAYRRPPEIHSQDRRMLPVAQMDPRFFEMVQENPVFNYRIYRVKNCLPPAYISYNTKVMPDRDKVIEAIFDEQNSFDPQKLTLLEAAGARQQEDLQSPSPVVPVDMVNASPEHLAITTRTASKSILVVNNQFYPGWVAHIDGKQSPILRCNGFMQGLPLPVGQHQITLDYEPLSLRYGFIFALLSLIWGALMILFNYRSSRKHAVELTK